MFRRAALALCFPLALLSTKPATADVLTSQYRVALMGIPVGTMYVERDLKPGKFIAKSRFSTTGMVAIVREVSFNMMSRGNRNGVELDPRMFRERMNTGKRKSNGKVNFKPDDPRWDPNTSMIYAIAPRPVAKGCAVNEEVFDGKRTHQLKISELSRTGTTLTCKGTFMRTAGYTAEQLSHVKGYEFIVHYRQQGDKFVFTGAESSTDYGRVTLTPR